jgi:aryl-phospho-beta-D-glucosidase BglC (GH1 family)
LIIKKIFENEIEHRSGRKIYKIYKNYTFQNKLFDFFKFNLINKYIFNIFDRFSLSLFSFLLILRSYNHKDNILASYPGSGLGQFLSDKKNFI